VEGGEVDSFVLRGEKRRGERNVRVDGTTKELYSRWCLAPGNRNRYGMGLGVEELREEEG
jgi:hypothetical protein